MTARAGRRRLSERLEDPVQLIRRDANAAVAHFESDFVTLVGHAHVDASSLGELDRVRQKIEKDLANLSAIALDEQPLGRTVVVERQSLLYGEGLDEPARFDGKLG